MTTYAWRAVEAEGGRRRRGVREGTGPNAVRRALESEGLLVLDVAPAEASERGDSWTHRFGRAQAVLEATRALGTLLDSGMPLTAALEGARHIARPDVRKALADVGERVRRGDALAAALSARPDLFAPIYIGLVRAGERSGDLAGAFRRLTDQLERETEVRSRLVSASIYPMLLAALGGVSLLILLLFVVPRFADLLADTGVALPASTAVLLALAGALRRFWPVALLLVGATLAGAGSVATTEAGRRVGARLLLRLPLIRTLRRQALAARFARLVGVLVGGGAPLLSALDDAAESVADPVAADEIARVRDRVREGASLHGALGEGTLFPPVLARLVTVGEESGRLREFLLKAAEIMEDRAQRSVERLIAMAEPAMIVVFGAVIALVAFALLQAIYGVNAEAFR